MLLPVSSGLAARAEVLVGLVLFLLPVPTFPHVLDISFHYFSSFSFPFSPSLSGITGYTGGGRKGNAGSVAR